MRKPRLTDKALRVNGKLAHDYEYDGGTVTVHDSCRNALLVIELFEDQSVSPADKAELLFRMLFPKPEQIPPEKALEAMDSVLWDMAGVDMLDTREAPSGGAQAFDWQEDAMRIRASLLMAYGLDWETASRDLTFAELCDLLGMLLEADSKTPFAEAVYYRTAKPPAFDGHNRAYVDAWKVSQKRYRLHTAAAVTEERKREDEAASAAFSSLWKAANRG